VPTVEVDEGEYGLLQKLKVLHDTLYSSADTGMELKQLIKKKFPSVSIPEIDVPAPHVARMSSLEKKLDTFIQKLSDDRDDQEFSRQLGEVRSEFSLTDDGMELVKRTMIDRKIADPWAAAAYVQHKTPTPAQPSGVGASKWNFLSAEKDGDADMKELLDDPEGWLDKQIPIILNEERQAAVRVPRG
jgi:hypothetical protein